MTEELDERGAELFPATRWSLVVHAGRRPSDDEAKDLVQGFLAELIEGGFLPGADRSKGRFRSYMLDLDRPIGGLIPDAVGARSFIS